LYIIVQNAFNSLDAVPYKVLPFRSSRSAHYTAGLCSVHEPLERKHFSAQLSALLLPVPKRHNETETLLIQIRLFFFFLICKTLL